MGRTSHPSLVSSLSLVSLPSLVFFLLLIYFSLFLIKKKKKKKSCHYLCFVLFCLYWEVNDKTMYIYDTHKYC